MDTLVVNSIHQPLEVDPEHEFSGKGEGAIIDIARFLQKGVDLAVQFDNEAKAASGGDGAHGEELYASTCSACHGDDGRMINLHDADDPEFIGNIAVDNPWGVRP